MRVTEQFKRDLDALRRVEPDLPSQTEMIHRLVNRAMLLEAPLAHSAKSVAKGAKVEQAPHSAKSLSRQR